jgi:hypothetical protein
LTGTGHSIRPKPLTEHRTKRFVVHIIGKEIADDISAQWTSMPGVGGILGAFGVHVPDSPHFNLPHPNLPHFDPPTCPGLLTARRASAWRASLHSCELPADPVDDVAGAARRGLSLQSLLKNTHRVLRPRCSARGIRPAGLHNNPSGKERKGSRPRGYPTVMQATTIALARLSVQALAALPSRVSRYPASQVFTNP